MKLDIFENFIGKILHPSKQSLVFFVLHGNFLHIISFIRMLQALFFQEVNDHGFIFVCAKYNNILNPTASIKFCKNIIL